MLQGFLVRTAFLRGELVGAFVELRGHFRGFFGGTAEGNQNLGEFGDFHAFAAALVKAREKVPRSYETRLHCRNHFIVSRGTILMLMMPMRLSGRSCGCVGVVPIFSKTSSPLISLPNAVY